MNSLLAAADSGDPSRLRPRQVLSTDVFEWPEFKALAKRLGVNLEVSTTVLTIQLAGDRPVAIVHEHEALDMLRVTVQPPMKQYIDKKGGSVLRCSFFDPKAITGTGQCILDAGHKGDCAF